MHNSMLDSFAYVGEAIAGSFTGLTDLTLSMKIDNHCNQCNGSGSIREYPLSPAGDFPDEEMFSELGNKIECTRCKGSGVITSEINIGVDVTKKAGEKKPAETTKKK